jgi:mandelamide amidase
MSAAQRLVRERVHATLDAGPRAGNAFVTLLPDRAWKEPPHGPLSGVLLSVKDNITVQGAITSAGCPALADQPMATADAPTVAALIGAGARLVATTAMHELAMGVTSNNAWTGPVTNPADPTRTAGGSSGGAAAAIARGLVDLSLASDTGGSSRIPAALCGVTGFRPTTGRYTSAGLLSICPSRDSVGLIARDARLVQLADAVLTGSSRRPDRPLAADLTGVRLGVLVTSQQVDRDVQDSIDAALRQCEAAGAELVAIDAHTWYSLDGEYGFALALYEIRQVIDVLAERVGASAIDFADRCASPDVTALLQQLIECPPSRHAYLRARDVGRPALITETLRLLGRSGGERVDALVAPTVPVPAPPIGDDTTTAVAGEQQPVFPLLSRHTSPGSVAGTPGVTLPVQPTPSGLAVGLALDGGPGADDQLLTLACRVQDVLARAQQ